MDPITQATIGVAASQLTTLSKLKKHCWWIGALAGMAPDLDILIRSSQNPSLFLTYHRHFTHALIFIPIGGSIIAGLLLWLFAFLRPHRKAVFIASIAAYATHGILDACTSYGTLLLWPFNETRYAWDILSIIDPIFTGLLLIGVVATQTRKSLRPLLMMLTLALIYLGIGILQHHRASNQQLTLINQRQQCVSARRVTPGFGQLLTWRSIYRDNNTIFSERINLSLFSTKQASDNIKLALLQNSDTPHYVKASKTLSHDLKVFNWFADGYVAVACHDPFTLIDARYLTQDNPVVSLWGYRFPSADTRAHAVWVRKVQIGGQDCRTT